MTEATRAVDYWELLGDGPAIFEARKIRVFLCFLADEKAHGCEIVGLTPYECRLRATDGERSVFYTASVTNETREERRLLYDVLKGFPEKMPKYSRERIAAHVGVLFNLVKTEEK